jgi:hypothetical protein
MEAKVAVAVGQGVASLSVVIQPRRPGHDELPETLLRPSAASTSGVRYRATECIDKVDYSPLYS